MKKSLVMIFALCFSVVVFGQATDKPVERKLSSGLVKAVNEVDDFTITDSDGNAWNLYDQLALGKTVFLDLFFST